MANLAEIIRTHHAEILERWTKEARRAAAARGLDRPEFQNTIPEYLLSLADAEGQLGRYQGKRREQVESHFSSRLRLGFTLAEIVEEFALLGRSIASVWRSDRGVEPPHHTEIQNLLAELHLASAAVTDMFAKHMMEDEQADKKLLRLLQQIASDALQDDGRALKLRLRDVLSIVTDAMAAQTATLLLFSPEDASLQLLVSVGLGEGELETYARSLDPRSFVGRVAEKEEATSWRDGDARELVVSDTLRRSGVHSLLGVRLPPRHLLLAVLYVGLAEERAFTTREIRRLELIGQHLTVHLDNARLFAALRGRIMELDRERTLREGFVSVLAHDLRGPLTAARVSAQILVRHPERLDQRRDLAIKIDRNIERTDRMIRDLLDTNRIRAGQALPLRIDDCDLAGIAREVFEELVATFGDRFSLQAEERIMGWWSSDELRRSLWNLATNAVKYGAVETTITIGARRTADGAEAFVHNWGTPISDDEKGQLFRPFSRAPSAVAGGQKGWGLGLTLVQGCAAAHGGHVSVESSAEAGTTFRISLPPDARRFQPSAETAERNVEASVLAGVS